jgi:hypothetical protein
VDADTHLVERLDELIAHFNKRSLDLPDGLFTRRTQLLLNGVPFEALLGRAPDDPLVLMLTRGPAGYRFASKALQHAVPDVRLERGELAEGEADGGRVRVVRVACWLSGHYRGTGGAANDLFETALTLDAGGALAMAAVTIDAAALARLREARLLP